MMFHDYSDHALRRLGASLIQSEKPTNSAAAMVMLKERLGAYVSNSQFLSELVRRHYQDSSSS
jgi:hypothetical protein